MTFDVPEFSIVSSYSEASPIPRFYGNSSSSSSTYVPISTTSNSIPSFSDYPPDSQSPELSSYIITLTLPDSNNPVVETETETETSTETTIVDPPAEVSTETDVIETTILDPPAVNTGTTIVDPPAVNTETIVDPPAVNTETVVDPPAVNTETIVVNTGTTIVDPPAVNTETAVVPPAVNTETIVDPPAVNTETVVVPPASNTETGLSETATDVPAIGSGGVSSDVYSSHFATKILTDDAPPKSGGKLDSPSSSGSVPESSGGVEINSIPGVSIEYLSATSSASGATPDASVSPSSPSLPLITIAEGLSSRKSIGISMMAVVLAYLF